MPTNLAITLTLIVTLTTDFGLRDYYAAVLKGAMLTQTPTLTFIDVSHQVKAHDIIEAAFILRHAYASFPIGTVHVVCVDNFFNQQTDFVAVEAHGHYFLAPDNGVLSLLFDELPFGAFRLLYDAQSSNFPLKDVFARAVGHLANGLPLDQIGIPAHDLVQRITLQPVVSQDLIRGSVIHIDGYENVILNIHRSLYDRVSRSRPFELYFKRHHPITAMATSYHDVAIGETLCLFNSANFLEIAVSMGKAATLLDLNVEDPVQIIFSEKTA